MNIFLAFLQSDKDYPIPAYKFWQHYIKNGIIEAGDTWTECRSADWVLGLIPKSSEEQLKWKEDAWHKTVAMLKKQPVDLFLSYLYPEQIDMTAIAEIKKMGIPCVNFFCDNIRNFRRIPVEFSVFDLNWVPEYGALKLYQNAGYPFINLPMPMWVNPKLRVIQPEANQLATFIGSKDIQRLLFFEETISKNPKLPLIIHGKGWDETSTIQPSQPNYGIDKKLLYQFDFIKKHGLLPYLRKLKHRNLSTITGTLLKSRTFGTIGFDEYYKLTAESMITIGISRYPSFHFPLFLPDSYSRLRDIEAPMLGACYLTEYTPGIEFLYDLGVEIETYTDAESFNEKVKELQHDDLKRKKLRTNGQKRALEDHNITKSLNRLAKKLNN